MENMLYENKEILCRACLEMLDNCTKHDIFLAPDLAKKLNECTSLSVELKDKLPRYICDSCLKKLEEFQQFRIMCIESVERFHKMLEGQQDPIGFEEEKLDFDLSKQNDLQIIVEESQILLHPRLKEEMLSVTKRTAAKMNTIKNLGTDVKEFSERNFRTRRRSKRNMKSALNSNENIVDDSEQKINVTPTNDPCTGGSIDEQSPMSRLSDEISDLSDSNTTTDDKEDNKTKIQSGVKRRTYSKRKFNTFKDTRKGMQKSQVYQCDICPMRFLVEHRLVAHKRSHAGLTPYVCNLEGCGKGFSRWHCLNEHLKQHQGTIRRYKCNEEGCGKVYKHKPTLTMHMRKCHKKGPELELHICEICGKVFKSSAILNDHRYTHKDKSELPFPCTEADCDRRFSSKEKLKVHRMRHAGIKNYECSYCGMRKTTRNELKIHINYHTLERTWPCRFCEHVCNSSGNLKMHVRTVHERAKDYACRFCKRKFAKHDTRKYHEMTHTGEKPNECKECGKRFTQPAALRTHTKIHLRNRTEILAEGAVNVVANVSGNGNEIKKLKCDNKLASVSKILETSSTREYLDESNGVTYIPGLIKITDV